MKDMRYRIGIDVGLNSVGLAAIEIDDDDMPVRILNAQSVIHDGGVDPTKQKEAISRKNIAGVSRRARRMVHNRRQRLDSLDEALKNAGYPTVESESLTAPFEEWHVRARLAESFIEDEATRREELSIALRHIARHRGWRNPYHRVESLLVDNPYSEQYEELKKRAEELAGRTVMGNPTPAQLVMVVLRLGYAEPPRLRTSTKRGEGLLPRRLMQEDNANELKRIFDVQRVPRSEWEPLFREVFQAESPKGSGEKRVGRDPFDPSQPRALKASLTFQRYRIVNVLTNLRIREEDGYERPLTVLEKQSAYELLASDSKDDITWIDVANRLGYARSQLKGIGSMTKDGEERIFSTPQRLTSLQRIREADRKIAKPLLKWWKGASDTAREAMIRLLSNTVDFDKVHDDLAYADAIAFIDELDDEAMVKLDSIDLPAGRAAYGEETLHKLTERMLTTDDDLQAARKVLFHVSDYWRPAADPIGAPLGNPSADRVVKIVNQWLTNCRNRWGDPVSVQIEHVRSGFKSAKTAREYERDNEKRSVRRANLAKELRASGYGDHNDSIRRLEALQRQHSQCLYCGRMITFETCDMDHIVPRSGAGSTNTRANLMAVCKDCNGDKQGGLFSVWVKTKWAQEHGVSLKATLQRVDNMLRDCDAKAWRRFQQEVKMRLRQTEKDDPIDNRSIESVAWMANELHRRINWYFNAEHYRAESDKERAEAPVVDVRVFRGQITNFARKASGLENRIHFFGPKGKTRLDRRHHAVDAAVIAMLQPSVAKTLMVCDSIRVSQMIVRKGQLAEGERSWKDYPYKDSEETYADYRIFRQWRIGMSQLTELLNDAFDHNRVTVRQPLRLQLDNSIAHDATVKPLKRVRLGDAMDADLIRRASAPALWCALTRHPDFDEKTGLPVNDMRRITVHGTSYTADDEVGFFAGQSAQVAVRGGSADVGSAIHHARVYRCWKQNARGARKYWYGMIRVFQTDLLKFRGSDLFSAPLPPQSVSMRWGEPRTVQAVQSGNAEYLGWLVVGDEIHVDLSRGKLKGQIGEFAEWCGEYAYSAGTACCTWVVDGFMSNKQLRLHPRLLASEGLKNVGKSKEVPDAVQKIVAGNGWLPSPDVFSSFAPEVIRRNALGEPRWHSKTGLPCSWRWSE